MRTYIGVDLPDSLKVSVDTELVSALRPAAPEAWWTPSSGWFIALVVMDGHHDVDDNVAALGRAMSSFPAFEASLGTVSYHWRIERASAVSVDVAEGYLAMSMLSDTIEEVLRDLGRGRGSSGFPRSQFELARCSPPADFTAPRWSGRGWRAPFLVDELAVVVSRPVDDAESVLQALAGARTRDGELWRRPPSVDYEVVGRVSLSRPGPAPAG